ncbi:MAG TPA: glutamate-cysteine ligase family protein [Longimicrobiales bacterium]|nr:glutamate-cysteine ligase family protein [Longimicrobiales bacterium]
MTRDLAPLRALVRGLFEPTRRAGPPRTGLEVEAIPVLARDGRPVPPRPGADGIPGTLPVLRELARRRGWIEEDTGSGVPRFGIPAGGILSFEPGGQIELSSAALVHLPTLDAALEEVLSPLEEGLEREGIRLLARGVDPASPPDAAHLVLNGERYPRQRAHYDRRGPLGRVMMLQSAALHVNADLGEAPGDVWRAANRLAPLFLAIFANSPSRCGARTPARSQRATLWRELDPGRTGIFAPHPDERPWEAYLWFALDADAFLLGPAGEPARPFRAWWDAGASLDDARRHLTTLFPEVRPRGYLEIRCMDAVPLRYAAVAGASVTALLHGRRARQAVLREIPEPTPERLERAGRAGVGDAELRAEATWLRDRVLDGLGELGPAVADPALADRVSAFFDAFPATGTDPGARPESWLGSRPPAGADPAVPVAVS